MASETQRGMLVEANSHGKPADKVLGTLRADQIETFLMDTVNLPWSVTYPHYRPYFDRWLRRWQRLFTHIREVVPEYNGPSLEDILDGGVQTNPESDSPPSCATLETVQVPRRQLELFAPVVRTTLCRLWVEKDDRQRDWYCYRLRDAHRQMVCYLEGMEENTLWGGADTPKRLTDYALQEVPRLSPFEAAIYWLQLNHAKMLRCANAACETPYFFRPEKSKRQMYCSPECADPARREAKLRWWNENRKDRGKETARKKEEKKKKKKKKRRKK